MSVEVPAHLGKEGEWIEFFGNLVRVGLFLRGNDDGPRGVLWGDADPRMIKSDDLRKMTDALRSDNPDLRWAAAGALGEWGGHTRTLYEAFSRETDETVAVAMVRAIGTTGGDNATFILGEIIDGSERVFSEDLRTEAVGQVHRLLTGKSLEEYDWTTSRLILPEEPALYRPIARLREILSRVGSDNTFPQLAAAASMVAPLMQF